MAWWDGFAAVDYALGQRPAPSTGFKPYRAPSFQPRSQQGGSGINWSELSSGRAAPSRASLPTAIAAPIEKFNVSLPYSSTGPRSPYEPPPPAAPQSTQGDLIGSFAAAAGQAVSNINLANAIPFFMERINTAAHDLAAADIPVVSPVAGLAQHGTQAFIDAVHAASQPVGQALDAFPTWVRDSQLRDRAKLYRAIANGETPDYGPFGPVSSPIATLGHLANVLTPGSGLRAATGVERPLAGITGQTVSEQAYQARRWQEVLLTSVDPQKRLDAETRMAILRESIDLPESVKLQLERGPGASDDDVAKWLDEAPEGKQWSYDAGAGGVIQNIANPMLFYIAEARAGGAALSSARASTIPGVASTAGVALRGIAATAKLQTAAVATGIGLTAVNTTMGAIARYQGADAAIAWFDNANRTTEFSDDPMVQLATGFAVNPFAAVGGAKRGVVKLKHGLVDVPLKAVTRGKLEQHYTSEDRLLDMTRRMFKLGSKEEAAVFLDEQGLREQAPDMILATALDTVLDRLPKEERLAWNAMYSDPVERAGATLARWGQQALDLIEKDPDLVAARFYDHDWNYRMMPGPFNAEVAAKIALDYRRAVDRTYSLRAEQQAVVGYRELLPPEGQALARSMLDGSSTPEGTVPLRVLQDMVADMPALRKHWGGTPMTDALPRVSVERIIDDAAAEWERVAKVNPRKVATGVDPVLRPDSPTLQRDYAEALGTSVDTIDAISEFDPKSAAHADLLGAFLRDKLDIDPTGKTPEELWSMVADHVDTVTQPWREMGNRVAAAETQMTRLRGELARVKREGGRTESDRTVRIQREINELADLVRLAGDPIRTTAARAADEVPARGLGDTHLAELAARKVDALERLRVVQSVSDELKAAGLDESHLSLVVRGADGELAWAYDLLGDPPTAVVDGYLAFRTAAMQVTRSVKGQLSSRRQLERGPTVKAQELVRDTEAAPGSYQWAQIASSPGFVKRLRQIGDEEAFHQGMTGNQMADIVEAAGLTKGVSGEPLEDIAARMTETREAAAQAKLKGALGGKDTIRGDRAAEGVAANKAVSDARGGTAESGGAIKASPPAPYTPETALQHLADLKAARERALDGKGIAAVKRTAAIKVADDYVAQAEADRAARELVYDAEYDAFWHPRAVAKVQEITASPDELWPGLRAVVEGDPALSEGIGRVATKTGLTAEDILSDPAHAAAVRAELVPAGFEAPIEGLIREWTDLDHLITSGDAERIAALSEQFAAARAGPRPPARVPRRVAEQLAKIPKTRRSYQYRRAIADAHGDFKASPSAKILDDPANRTGVEVLSVLNHGIPGTRPATIDGIIALIRDIENGSATKMGIGPELQAEAQRVARALLDDAATNAKRDPAVAGAFSKGFFPEDETALAATIDDLLSFDQTDPLGTLQYGLKKAPKDAVVMEWSQVPGLAEELLSKRFEPFSERIGTTHVRQAFNYVFGPRSNAAIRQETLNRFTERVGRQGVTPETARAIWDAWGDMSRASRMPVLRKGPTGIRTYIGGDRPLYADTWNIPNRRMEAVAHGAPDLKIVGVIGDLSAQGKITTAEAAAASRVDFAKAFRESASFTRRTLADKVPLGRALADAYGTVAHNEATTTLYYWFRFGLDIRYHAMNYLESQILYAGRAGLRKGEIDEGLLGQTEQYLRNLDSNPTMNTGYPFSRDRHAYAYKTFLKEQPTALRDTLKGVASEDPALMRKAMTELAATDPQLRDMIDAMGTTPEKYLAELDAWHRKMLNNVDETTDAATIDEALAKEMAQAPHLAEVFDRLGQANKELWTDIRQTFYGNADRSRAERFLNSYLLFWPLSYQVKSTKWFLRVLGDRVGGIQTNALGAVALDRMADSHNRLLATDTEYRDWFEKHDTLVFAAQMFFPVSFDATGVSLNPVLRSMFFDRTRAGMEVGPIYTFNKVIRPAAEELYVDLYPTLGDFLDGPYRAITGQREPGPPAP